MTLLTVDGSNAIHRAHYAVPPMSYNGTPTNAVVGFMRIVKSNLRKTEADNCAIVFDRPGANHRHLLFPDYKGCREKKPEVTAALKAQIPIIVALCRALGLRVIGKRNIEGDDIVGQLAVTYVKANPKRKSIILSSDKDFGQLLTDKRIQIINPAKGLITRGNIEEVFGVPANLVIDYLMLEGDKIDNIPGVPGVGEKTAQKLLSEYGHVEDIPAEAFPKWARENYAAIRKQFKLTRKLITIRLDSIEYDLSRLRRREPDKAAIKEVCKQFGLRTLQGELLSM